MAGRKRIKRAAYDTDGVEMIEAVENQKLTFCLGVQFHPEVAVAKVSGKSEAEIFCECH